MAGRNLTRTRSWLPSRRCPGGSPCPTPAGCSPAAGGTGRR
jgi:hypothetical protein